MAHSCCCCWALWNIVGNAVAASIGRFPIHGASSGSWWCGRMRGRVGAPTSRSSGGWMRVQMRVGVWMRDWLEMVFDV
ncbi:hypothetical protein PVAP13_8KG334708 [Panicum virgatum]|uniref:Secreted protein n=1 Tax=Panicum virgatum TaxID=38727 RepID=A0A8T0PSZ0_PANVG|nr:hypothetical protein PVAP13_8KG334708 [Panicum virgatum]